MSAEQVTPDQVRAQVERLCAHPLIKGKKREGAIAVEILQCAINAYLAGNQKHLTTGYIASNVTGEEKVDENAPSEREKKQAQWATTLRHARLPEKWGYPKTRAKISQLRSKLAEYYKDHGFADPVHIRIVGGGCVPEIEKNPAHETEPLDNRSARIVHLLKTAVEVRTIASARTALQLLPLLDTESTNPRLIATIPFCVSILGPLVSVTLTINKPQQPFDIQCLLAKARKAAPGFWERAFAEGCVAATHKRDWNRALELFEIAESASEGESTLYWWHAALLASKGRYAEAIYMLHQASMRQARTNLCFRMDLAVIQTMAGLYEDADTILADTSAALFPNDPFISSTAAIFFEAQDRLQDAREALYLWGQALYPNWEEHGQYNLLDYSIYLFILGRSGSDISRPLAMLFSTKESEPTFPSMPLILVLVGAKRYDEAISWMRRAAFDEHDPCTMWFHIFPPLRHLRGHKGYEDLLLDLKLEIPLKT